MEQNNNAGTVAQEVRRILCKMSAVLTSDIRREYRTQIAGTRSRAVIKNPIKDLSFSKVFWDLCQSGAAMGGEITDDDILSDVDAVHRNLVTNSELVSIDCDQLINRAKEIANDRYIRSYYTVLNHWACKAFYAKHPQYKR